MAWFKTTDTLMSDLKVLSIPLERRAEALGTWLACGTWCAQHLTNGRVPFVVVTQLVGETCGPEWLVRVGMWRETKAGYTFVNWAKYQPTRAEIEAKRQATAERVKRWREQRDGNAVTDALVTPPPSRPVPARPGPSPSSQSPSEGKSPKQRASNKTPQPCGRVHDQAKPCRACAKANEEAAAEALRVKAEKRRAHEAKERAAREAERDATPPDDGTGYAKALEAVKAARG